jgi:hypothetical protein
MAEVGSCAMQKFDVAALAADVAVGVPYGVILARRLVEGACAGQPAVADEHPAGAVRLAEEVRDDGRDAGGTWFALGSGRRENMARRSAAASARETGRTAQPQRRAKDETMGGGGGGRGGRSRGTATRSSTRTTSESTGEVERVEGLFRDSHAAPKGRGSKPDAPRGRKGQTSGRGSTGARKSANRPGASGTGSKKGTRGSSSRRPSGSRSGGGKGSKKKR